jgi:hypothetical protein
VVAERAANAIFELEKTRLRHGRQLAGTAEMPVATPLPSSMATQTDLVLKDNSCDEDVSESDVGTEFDSSEQQITRELAREYIRQHGLPQDETFLQTVVQLVIAKRRE